MYPLKFNNLYYDKIWGGRNLELFRSNLPEGNVGESWDVACHPHGISVVKNGRFKGMKLDELIKLKGRELLGTKIVQNRFPLLVKLINSKDKLSVQVHPNDKYAKEVENEIGKTEIWYVVEAFEGANLVVGTKECTKEQFAEAIKSGDLDKYLNKFSVKKGEVYFIKSGLVHAIGEGVIIAEIQQNSDITYRVYDYNRGRKVNLKRALDVIDLKLIGNKITGVEEKQEGYIKIQYCSCSEFVLELYDINKVFKECSSIERFYIFTCVDGQGQLCWDGGELDILKGDSILIPATTGEYEFLGEMKILKSYVP